MAQRSLSKISSILISAFDRNKLITQEKTISVNPVVAEVASWYEKLRTAMDYREEEVILRSSIERILKRRLLLGGSGKSVAAPLIRELVWARYFPDSSVPETIVEEVEKKIDLYLRLQELIFSKNKLSKSTVREWILNLMSSDIERTLKPDHQKELMSNFIYHIFRSTITISDDLEKNRDVQTFIAVRRAYAKEDLPLLRFHLFLQYFGDLNEQRLDNIADHFIEGYTEIQEQLQYPIKDKIYGYIKKQIIPFFILEDVLKKYPLEAKALVEEEEKLALAVLEACSNRYKGIMERVKRAIVRSVIFLFFTKALFALAVEGTFENLLYGKVLWGSMVINTLTPPLLMVVVGMFIKTPGKDNSNRILGQIKTILFEENPVLERPLVVKKTSSKTDPLLSLLFIGLWVVAVILGFGAIVFILSKLHFNILSMAIFLFFLAIVSFLSYRINQTANMYTIKQDRENVGAVLFDFFFMPFIQIGKNLTMGISQLNILLSIFDMLIEAPFKSLFSFFEQWFLYLRTQREKLD